jgi:hypothetical protein
MKIIIKLFSRPIILELAETNTVNDIKMMLKQMENIELEQQRLVYKREPLDDEFKTLKECEINDGSVIYLMLRLFVKKESNESTKFFRKTKIKNFL